MHTHDAIRKRRAVKHYDPKHRMRDQEIQELFQLAIQAPTSFNIQNWRFVCVRDPELRIRLRAASFDQAQVTDASMLVILCADLNAHRKDPERYWRNAPTEVQERMLPMISGLYENKPELQRDEAMRSVGIAAQTLMLAAQAMGYESCPMIGFEADKVAQLIGLPADHVIGMYVAVGKGTQKPWPKPGQLDMDEVLIHDGF